METPTFLYKPNFCAECGEKIERDSWHFWTSRSFCDNCEPVFRLNRLLPAGIAAAALFFGGMFFGQIGQRAPKTAPVISTHPAPTGEKPQVIAPKQLLSSNQPLQIQNSANEQPIQNSAPAAGNAKTAVAESRLPEAVYICGARTQKGTPCSRRVKTAGRCWQHLGRASILEQASQDD